MRMPGQKRSNESVVAGNPFDRLLKTGHCAAANSKDAKEFVPKDLPSASSRVSPAHSLAKPMALWRISFHEIGNGEGVCSDVLPPSNVHGC